MTERGLPIVGGAPACPFVAFEDDRDERATSPDHRHRCYAEAQPAPRALAHQEAYCLSSAFPVCPTFQDWARREAARARPADLPPAEPEDDEEPPIVEDRPPRRGNREAWASPPPWLRGAGAGGASSQPPAPASAGHPSSSDDDEPGLGPAAGLGAAGLGAAAAASGGLSGSFADRMASDRGAAPPPGMAGPARRPGWDDDPRAQPAGEPPDRSTSGHGAGYEDDRSRDIDDARDDDGGVAPPARRRRERLESGSDRLESPLDRDVDAPSWERPRRLEAYPTLRSRRLSGTLTSIVLGLLALLLVAGAAFAVSKLFNLGGSAGASSPIPSVEASAPIGSSEPTIAPAATQQTYTVVAGDTLTKIAKKFGVSLNDLIAANQATLPDPNKLKIGDVLVIPVPQASTLPGTSPASS